MHKHRNHRNNLPWILNLIGHIQNTLAASNRITEYILLLFDVFVFVITIFSGYDVFLSSSEEISNELLPHGLAALFGDKWNQHVEQVLFLNFLVSFVLILLFSDSRVAAVRDKFKIRPQRIHRFI